MVVAVDQNGLFYHENQVCDAERLKQRLTQAELAEAVRSSQSRVAKMEAGDPTVSIDLLVRSLIALGASNADLAKIIAAR